MDKKKLLDHFTKGLDPNFRGWIGAEIETHIVYGDGKPISTTCSQKIFKAITNPHSGWKVATRKGKLITAIKQRNGSRMLYELGKQNIEIVTLPTAPEDLCVEIKMLLSYLYYEAEQYRAFPLFKPIMECDEDLLVIADERDVSWLKLDGYKNLSPLAHTASVQFTFETEGPEHAILLLNKLADNRERLTASNPYVQEEIWKTYIQNSDAGYKENRYGVVKPNSIEEYVDMLALHDVVTNGTLVPFKDVWIPDIDLFLRSIWWNFRLRRYNNRLCIEVRTLARRDDAQIKLDLKNLLSIIS